MNGRDRQKLLDHQADEDLARMFDKVAELEGQALWEAYQAELEAGTLPEMPKELDEVCSDRICVPEKKEQPEIRRRKGTGIDLKKVAIIALTFVIFASSLVMSVDAIRLPVLNFLVDKDNRYSMIYFWSEEPETEEIPLFNKIQSIRLPEGYSLTHQWEQPEGSFGFRFENEDQLTMQISFVSSSNLFNYDIEDAEQIKTKVLDNEGIFIKKNGFRIIWMDEKHNGVFDVRADDLTEKLFWEYVLRIAESLKS